MDTNKFLTGPELEQLYHQDKTNAYFQEPENIKSLFTHILRKDMGELTNSDLEIIDFCHARILPDGFPDEKKLQFMYDKFDMIRKEKEKKSFYGNVKKIAACFVFIIIGSLLVLSLETKEAEAGIFDWVRSLFIEEEEEQLIIRTPNSAMPMNLREIEMKEGHLPERLPEGYVFEKSDVVTSYALSMHQYIFNDADCSPLIIEVTEISNIDALHECQLELSKSSLKTLKNGNYHYYYITNNDKNSISWISNQTIHCISSTSTFHELENILSYYKTD